MPETQSLGYSEQNEVVTLRMAREDFQSIVFALGVYAGSVPTDSQWLRHALALANRINVGNPRWSLYAVEAVS
jgi:hypothetical protein